MGLNRRTTTILWTILLAVVCLLFITEKGFSQTVAPATGGESISADDANQTYTSLSGPVITENYAGQLSLNGTIIFNAPSGFDWDTTGTAPAVTISNASGGGGYFNTGLTIQLVSRTARSITFQVTASSYVSSFLNGLFNTPGVATFGNFRIRPNTGVMPNSGIITNSGTTAPGGAGAVSYGQISMTYGAATRVVFDHQPTNTTVNKTITPAVTAHLVDQFGNSVPTANVTVTISKSSGNGTLSGTLSQQTDASGAVSFNNLKINKTGTKVLRVSSSGLTSSTSNSFSILSAGQLTGFLVQSTSGGNIASPQTAGQPFALKITAVDGNNNTITSFNGTVDITSTGHISSGGGATANFVNGVLSSHDITITNTGSFTITVTETGGTAEGISNSFTVDPGSPDLGKSTITANPVVILNDGSSTSMITVQLKDIYGNNLTTGGHTVQLSTSASTLSGVTDNGDGTYTATLNSTTAPVTIANITGTFDGSSFSDKAQVIIAQFYTWTSSSNRLFASQTQLWNNASNWNGGSVPSSNQVAFIPSSPANNSTTFPVIEQNTNVLAIVIQTGASVTINSGNTLNVGQSISDSGSVFADYATINIGGDVSVSNLYGGTSGITLNGTSLQKVTGNLYAGTLNINNTGEGIETTGYINTVDTLKISSGTLKLDSGSYLNAFGDVIGSGGDSLITNNATVDIGGDYNVQHTDFSTSTVTFNGTQNQTFTNASQFKNLEIDNGKNVTASGNVTVSDSLRLSSGSLVIPSGSNLIANTKDITSGELKFNRVLADSGWVLLSSPVNTTYGSFLGNKIVTQGYTGSTYPSKQPNVMTYDETSSGTDNQRYRVPADSSSAITAGKGMFVYVFGNVPNDANYTIPTPDTLTASGEENEGTGGIFNFNVTYTATADTGWNLVGNPFGATINWDNTAAWTKTNMSNSIYVWNQQANSGNGAYLVWNGVTGSLGNGLVAPFQGFWVKADTVSPALKVSTSAKTISGVFYRSINRIPEITFQLQNDTTASHMVLTTKSYLMFTSNGKLGKDRWDAYQLDPLTLTYLSLYTAFNDGPKLAINSLPLDLTKEVDIPFGFEGYMNGVPLTGMYKLTWPQFDNIPDNWTVEIVDNKTGQTTDMKNVRQYSFTVNATKGKIASNRYNQQRLPMITKANTSNLRFTLKIIPGDTTQTNQQIPTNYKLFQNYPNPFNPSTTIKFGIPKTGNVKVIIYNLLGQRVAVLADQKFQAGYHTIVWNASDAASGLYFFQFIAGGKVMTKKMIYLK